MIAWDTPTFAIMALGCLVLVFIGYRRQRAGVARTMIFAALWIGIIALMAAIFAAVGS